MTTTAQLASMTGIVQRIRDAKSNINALDGLSAGFFDSTPLGRSYSLTDADLTQIKNIYIARQQALLAEAEAAAVEAGIDTSDLT